MKTILAILTILCFIDCQAQKGVNKNDMVGFGCYKGNLQTESVTKIKSLIDDSNYDEILVMLDSKSDAEKYLAVVVLIGINCL
tara:strand:+ start:2335 stop:2583 length:249 start_codon:yes stop_codon:yes gene_type:complete